MPPRYRRIRPGMIEIFKMNRIGQPCAARFCICGIFKFQFDEQLDYQIVAPRWRQHPADAGDADPSTPLRVAQDDTLRKRLDTK